MYSHVRKYSKPPKTYYLRFSVFLAWLYAIFDVKIAENCERFFKEISVINREYIVCLIFPILESFSKWRFQPGMKITIFETMEKGTANSNKV